MPAPTTTPPARISELAQLDHVTLDIGGMTCASCVRRVEKALARVEGVESAQVNLATEVATVAFDPAVTDLATVTGAVGRAGYTASAHAAPAAAGTATSPADTSDASRASRASGAPGAPDGGEPAERDREIRRLRTQWQVSLAAGLSMMVLMYLPLPIDTMDWLMPVLLVVATAVQFWAGRSFYAAAWAAGRHGAVKMNTLFALGTCVA